MSRRSSLNSTLRVANFGLRVARSPRPVRRVFGYMLLGVLLLVLWIVIGVTLSARADERKPLPVPAQGSICPSGYTRSPTSGYCVPNPGTRSNAVSKQGLAPCPIGTHESMQSFCVQEPR
jgi:hypothetical protein